MKRVRKASSSSSSNEKGTDKLTAGIRHKIGRKFSKEHDV